MEPFEPQSYKEAIHCKDAELWRAAIDEEYSCFMKNDTWVITTIPPGRKTIKKLVGKVKPGHGDVPSPYKARLVAKGYTQRHGVDFDQTFAPVVKHDSLRMILSIAAARNLEMTQWDIKTAFYMERWTWNST